MVFSAAEYIDDQFEYFQGFIGQLSGSIPILDVESITVNFNFIEF